MGPVASSRITAAVAVAAGYGDTGAAVRAQEPTETGAPLEVIIVTATRREASVQDVPFNMVALGPESLRSCASPNSPNSRGPCPGFTLPTRVREAATC